ncbi:hypothetical protein F2Q70_00015983 [Brassica cretica]|uniref:Uncharacterized protein n=1 Tax=Brassica cretica TaxID=69181 RepID=A0A8S9I0R3_BRACR|nr:hypothetical protein F2Q70_00015983 [Brassica cretica]
MQSSRKDRAEYGKDEQPYLQSIQSALIVMFCVNYFTAAQSIRLSPDVNSIVNVYLRGNKASRHTTSTSPLYKISGFNKMGIMFQIASKHTDSFHRKVCQVLLSPDVNSIANVYLRGNKLYLSKVVYSYQSIVSSSSAATREQI